MCVSYYGSGVPVDARRARRRRRARCCSTSARSDAYIPFEGVEALAEAIAGRPGLVLNVEEAGHAFDNHEAAMFYDEAAAAAAWSKTMAFLADHLPTPDHPIRPEPDVRAGLRLDAGRSRVSSRASAQSGQRSGRAIERAEVLVGGRHRDPAARRADQQALLDEERLVDVLDRLGLLADGDRQRRQPDRTAAELLAQRAEDARGRPCPARGRRRRTRASPSRAVAASTVPSPRTSAKSRTRRSSRLAMRGVPRERRAISHAPSVVDAHVEDARGRGRRSPRARRSS